MLNIRELQAELEPHFKEWDEAVRTGRSATAIRGQLRAAARKRLDAIEVVKQRGIYLFADITVPSGLHGLRYVGSASRQSLAVRIQHYIYDDSCLDGKMAALDDVVAHELAVRRMIAAMGEARRPKIIGYADDHLRTVRLTAGGSLFFAAIDAPSKMIEFTEGALTVVAWCLGARLENAEVSHLPSQSERVDAVELAREAVEGWGKIGL